MHGHRHNACLPCRPIHALCCMHPGLLLATYHTLYLSMWVMLCGAGLLMSRLLRWTICSCALRVRFQLQAGLPEGNGQVPCHELQRQHTARPASGEMIEARVATGLLHCASGRSVSKRSDRHKCVRLQSSRWSSSDRAGGAGCRDV